MKELEEHVNQAIILPQLGPTLPKELGGQTDARNMLKPILLTPQRIGIIKRFVNEMQLGPQIIFDITGQSVNFTYNKISGDIECQPANSVKLDFVIFTWRTKEEAMKKKANHNYQNLPNNLLIVSKESLPFIPTTKPM
jgi:hypothetical protein